MTSLPPAPRPLPLPRETYLSQLSAAAAAVQEALATGPDLAAPVPGCPGWTLWDVVDHVARVHGWARVALTAQAPPPYDTGAGPPDDAQDAAGLAAWAARQAGDLHAALAAADLSAECWGFGPKPRTVAFWLRRQAHETTVHAVDVRRAAGLDSGTGDLLPPWFAADGVDEVATIFLPRQVRLQRIQPLEASVALVATDRPDGSGHLSGRWRLGDDSRTPDATLSGPAADLLLLLWKRVRLEEVPVTVTGDEAAARAILAVAITP